MAITDEEELVASAVVYPGNTDEVQKVVQWANKYLVPLHPISMGRNCTSEWKNSNIAASNQQFP